MIRTALTLQEMLATDRMLEEIEINPLMVGADFAVAADAVIWKDTP